MGKLELGRCFARTVDKLKRKTENSPVSFRKGKAKSSSNSYNSNKNSNKNSNINSNELLGFGRFSFFGCFSDENYSAT